MISSGNVSGGAGGGIYWMYYQGGDKEEVDGVEGVRTRPGLCLSQDGRNWARIEGEHHTHAVLDVGSEGEWDELCIRDPKLLLAGPKDMRLFYHSIDKTTDVSRIGVATSKDGFQWQKNSSGFILDAGPEGSIDDLGVKSPCVARIGRNEYVMFYEALSSKHPGNPPFASRNRKTASNGNALQPLRLFSVKTVPGTKVELDDRTSFPWRRNVAIILRRSKRLTSRSRGIVYCERW